MAASWVQLKPSGEVLNSHSPPDSVSIHQAWAVGSYAGRLTVV